MRLDRPILALSTGALLLALATGCASTPKAVKSTTDLNDGAAAAAALPQKPPPAPVQVAEPAPPPPAPCSISRVHFSFDSDALDADARDTLKEAAACLTQKRPTDLVIEGHCDERGTTAYNLALGSRRAGAVKKYLADLGVTAPMNTISFGKELPLVPGTGEQAWSQNRRAELKLPGEKRTDGVPVALR